MAARRQPGKNAGHAAVREAADALRSADALLIGAGAGMGVDSGLPDFRGDEGFWRAYPPLAELGIRFTEMADPHWFESDPELAWGFYGHRLGLYRRTEPHDGFDLLKSWGARMRGGLFVVTSNVDGQFQKAGFDPDQVYECHGSIHHLQCTRPCRQGIWGADGMTVEVDESTFRACPPLPQCPSCGALARPNVLMFGDWSWIPDGTEAQHGRLQTWRRAAAGLRLAVVECGAGSSVPAIRLHCEAEAGRSRSPLVRVNTREPQGPNGTISLPMGALEALRAIDTAL